MHRTEEDMLGDKNKNGTEWADHSGALGKMPVIDRAGVIFAGVAEADAAEDERVADVSFCDEPVATGAADDQVDPGD